MATLRPQPTRSTAARAASGYRVYRAWRFS